MAASLSELPIQASPAETVDRLDRTTGSLGATQSELLKLLQECSAKQLALTTEYAPRINALLKTLQEQFDIAEADAAAARELIVKRGSKSAARLTGRHAWRSQTRVEHAAADDDLVAAFKLMGRRYARRFVRRVRRDELDKRALSLSENREAVTEAISRLTAADAPQEWQALGLRITESEVYACTPAGGYPLTSDQRIWPAAEGTPFPEILSRLIRPTDA